MSPLIWLVYVGKNVQHFLKPEFVYIDTKSLLQSMDTAEAFRCWPDLTKQVVVALKELHGIGLAHLDVRLPNICFNEEFQV